MRLKESRPCRSLAPLRRRLDAAALQHIGYRPATDPVAQVAQRPLNPGVSPTRIVLGHAHNQSGDLLHDPWPPRPAPVHEIPFLGDQSSVPAQQSIRRNDRLQFQQGLASHCLGFPREQRSLGVGEPDTLSAQPVFEQPVLGLKEFDDDQLMAMNPTSRDHQQKREQRWHGTHATSLSHASVELLDTTPGYFRRGTPRHDSAVTTSIGAEWELLWRKLQDDRRSRCEMTPCGQYESPSAMPEGLAQQQAARASTNSERPVRDLQPPYARLVLRPTSPQST